MMPAWDRKLAARCAHSGFYGEVERCIGCDKTADEIADDLDLALALRAVLSSARQEPEWR
jgi:hypothetical protein